MAVAAWVMIGSSIFLGLLTFGISIYAAVLLRDTLRANTAAVEQAKEANRITREADRAWMQVTIELEAGRVIDGNLHINYFIRAKNVGNKPALRATITFENLSSLDSREHHEGSVRRLLDKVQNVGPAFAVTFPGQQTVGFGYPIIIPLDKIPNYYPRVNAAVMYEIAGSREKKYSLDGFDICGIWNGKILGIGFSRIDIHDGMELRSTRTGFGVAT